MITIESDNTVERRINIGKNESKTDDEIAREKLQFIAKELMDVYLLTGDETANNLLQETLSLSLSLKKN